LAIRAILALVAKLFRAFFLSSALAVGIAASCVVETLPPGSSGGSGGAGGGGLGAASATGGAVFGSSSTGLVATSSTSTSSGTGGMGGMGGVDASVSCTQAQQEAAWGPMVKAPIQLPGKAGLLDLIGPPPLTEPAAEQILCQGKMLGDVYGDGTSIESWGDKGEAWLAFIPPMMLLGKTISLWPGYTGTLAATSRDGMHTYAILISGPIQKDGATFTLDWSKQMNLQGAVNELFDALLATFMPALLPVPDCFAASPVSPDAGLVDGGDPVPSCTAVAIADSGSVNFAPLGLTFWVASVSMAQPTPSTPNRIDLTAP
jgi:hypothetical protein